MINEMAVKALAALLNLTVEALTHQADAHTRAVQAWLSSRAPGGACFEGSGARATSTGLAIPLLNLAFSHGYPAGTPDEAILKEIASVNAFFAARQVPYYWWLGPTPRPSHLDQLLQAQQLTFDPPGLPAMIAPLPPPTYPTGPAFKVWAATTHADLEAASRIRHTAFRFPDGVGLDYFEAMATDWLAGDPARLFLAAGDEGVPAAMGALILGEAIPGVYVMATLPEWRGRGLGKAILAHILREAAAEGHRLIVLTASRLGYPLYQQFGFEHLFDYAIYRPQSPRVRA